MRHDNGEGGITLLEWMKQRGFPSCWMMTVDGMNDLFIDETIGEYHFRRVVPGDKDLFMAVRAETSDVAEFYHRYPAFRDFSWEKIFDDENEISMVVFHQPDDLFVGTCSFQGLQTDSLELGYDIRKELRGKGYGTGMVSALFTLSHKVFPEREIFVRIRKENLVSRHVAEKNGAQFVREVDPPEVVAIRTLLEQNKDLSRADEAKAAIERSKDSVLLYKV